MPSPIPSQLPSPTGPMVNAAPARATANDAMRARVNGMWNSMLASRATTTG